MPTEYDTTKPPLDDGPSTDLDSFEASLKRMIQQQPPSPLLQGRVVADTYELLHRLGQGGMGQVFEAVHLRTQGRIALKLIRAHLLASPRALQRFELEARHTASLRHPHIVTVIDYGRDGDLLYLAMELCPGRDLRDLLQQEGAFSWDVAAPLIEQVLLALQAAHESPRCLIHRDIKPANILVMELNNTERFIKVVDFGISKATGGDLPQRIGEELIGSPHFMAPEQFQAKPVSPATDLYAVGCTLFIMLTGRPPFEGTLTQLTDHHLHSPPPLDLLPHTVPASAQAWLAWLLRKEPRRRPANAAEAIQALRAAIATPRSNTLAIPATRTQTQEPLTSASDLVVLPSLRTRFIGRQSEMEHLDRLIAQGARLITLRGIGGMGKSRLAVEWARSRLADWPGGVYFCDLSEVRTLAGIGVSVANTLQLNLGKNDPLAVIGRILARRSATLIILDNFEQIVHHAPASIGAWLDATDQATFVVTSRQRLDMRGEQDIALEPLETEREAVELFLDRAQQARPELDVEEVHDDVVALLHELDGMPLAIELAAARTRIMSPAQMRERLGQRFKLLRSSRRDVSARQATLKATLDWSWELLEPCEQAAFVQCATFQGSFALEAAEAVIDLSSFDDDPWVIDVLASLVDKSLVRRVSEERFALFVSVREYALAHGVPHGARRRHIAYFAPYGREAMLYRLMVSHSPLEELRSAMENLEGALDEALTQGLMEPAALCALALAELFSHQGPYAQGFERLERVLTASQATPMPQLHMRLLLTAATLNLRMAHYQTAHDRLTEGLAIAAKVDEPGLESNIQCILALVSMFLGDWDQADKAFARSLTLALHSGEPFKECMARAHYGDALVYRGDQTNGRMHLETALRISRDIGCTQLEATTLCYLGRLMTHTGETKQARAHFTRSLKLARTLRQPRLKRAILSSLADLEQDQGHLALSRQYFQEVHDLACAVGDRILEMSSLLQLASIMAEQLALDEALHACHQGDALMRSANQTHGDLFLITKLRVRAIRGDHEEAQMLAEAARALTATSLAPSVLLWRSITLAHFELTCNADPTQALAHLKAIPSEERADLLPLTALEYNCIAALAHAQLGNLESARDHLPRIQHQIAKLSLPPGARLLRFAAQVHDAISS